MYDVAVVGGGISGCIAAIAAARYGANVILIERYGFFGRYPYGVWYGTYDDFSCR